MLPPLLILPMSSTSLVLQSQHTLTHSLRSTARNIVLGYLAWAGTLPAPTPAATIDENLPMRLLDFPLLSEASLPSGSSGSRTSW